MPGQHRRRCAFTLLLAIAVGVSSTARAVEIPRVLREAVAGRPAVAALLTDHTFRRTVVSTGRVLDRDLHEFLLSRPDIGAALARLLGLGKYRVRRTQPGVFEGTDGEGASTVLRIIDQAPGRRIFHARGRYVQRFFPDVTGKALVLLTTRYEEARGLDLAHGQLTVYARLDNRFLGWLLRLLIPFIGSVLDQKIAKAFASESVAVERLACDPEPVLTRLEESEPLPRTDVVAFRDHVSRALARLAKAGGFAEDTVREACDRTPPQERPPPERLWR